MGIGERPYCNFSNNLGQCRYAVEQKLEAVSMSTCKACGKQNRAEAKFCGYCRQSLQEEMLQSHGEDMPSSSGKVPESQSIPALEQVYTQLRNQILTLNPQKAGLVPSPETPNVWGVLMETGYSKAVVTLVSLADGTTSLYFSNGGGMIGLGDNQDKAAANASKAFVADAEKYFGGMTPTTSYPLPGVGQVKFYVLTFSGSYVAEAGESDLGNKVHPLFPLFYRGQEVITQVRLQQEKADPYQRELSDNQYIAAHAFIAVTGAVSTLLLANYTRMPPLNALCIIGGLLNFWAATGVPWWVYATICRMTRLKKIENPTIVRGILVVLGILLLGAGWLVSTEE